MNGAFAQNAALMVIDLQERLMPAIANAEAVLSAAEKLCRACALFELPVIATEQYPKGLGATVPAIREALPKNTNYLGKTAFSSLRDGTILAEVKRLTGKTFILCGAEAHVCVWQTACDLRAEGYDVIVCSDAVGSRDEENKRLALEDMRIAGARVLPMESIAFLLAEDAKSPRFKAISALVKS